MGVFGGLTQVCQLPTYHDRRVEIADRILKRRGKFFEGPGLFVGRYDVDEASQRLHEFLCSLEASVDVTKRAKRFFISRLALECKFERFARRHVVFQLDVELGLSAQ